MSQNQHDLSTPVGSSQTSSFISLEEIQHIISLTLTAPTGDNSQHWRFTWNGHSLAIFYVKSRGDHALNNNHHSTYLGLGCLLEALEIAASTLGYIILENLQLADPEKHLVAIVYLKKDPEIMPDELAVSLKKRCVDRRPYLKEKLPDSIKDKLNLVAKDYLSCQLHWLNDTPDLLKEYIVKSDEFIWRNSSVNKDFFYWTRLSSKEIESYSTGMPWPSLGLRKIDLPLLRIIRRWPQLISLLMPFGMKRKINKLSRQLIDSSGGIFCISMTSYTPTSIVEAGRLAFRTWLRLNHESFSVQPISLSSLTVLDVTMGFAPPQTSSSFLKHFRDGKKILHQSFNINDSYFPIWMFRFGRPATQVSSAMYSKRMFTEECLQIYSKKNQE